MHCCERIVIVNTHKNEEVSVLLRQNTPAASGSAADQGSQRHHAPVHADLLLMNFQVSQPHLTYCMRSTGNLVF